jgi:hypothetical protein
MNYPLEHKMQFIFEKRTKAYTRYVAGASEKKIASFAKNSYQRQALPGLERCGG